MAIVRDGAVSFSSSRCSYHVYVNFRAKDSCKTFVHQLYKALMEVGINAFLGRKNSVGIEMRKAMRESRISIIVFSEEYASSRWCLDELVSILERKRNVGHLILPVFYKVDPSHIRKQTGSYAKGFMKFEEEIMAETGEKKRESSCKVDKWRASLNEAGNLAGMVFEEGNEAIFVQEIVSRTWNKLSLTLLSVTPYPIGIYARIKDISLWLQNKSADVCILMIYGESGIGKTTLVKTVYNMFCERFEVSSFISYTGEIAEENNGLVHLQRQFLSEILKRKNGEASDVDDLSSKIKEALCSRKLLLVIDDVDQVEQLNALLAMRDWFSSGSKVIITTRNERIINDDKCLLYRAKKLDSSESLELFSLHAFGYDHPAKGYMKISKKLVHHCQGLPLALQVLGSSLRGATLDQWERILYKLEKKSDSSVMKVLEVSYESLQDDHEKNLFLDIACFFVGKNKDYIVNILDECDYYTTAGIHNLIERCLLTVGQDNKLMMHHLLQDMGREVIRQESPVEPGKRSRLWQLKDALIVLQEETGTQCIEGLNLNLDACGESITYAHKNSSKRHSTMNFKGHSAKRLCLNFFSWLPTSSSSARLLSTLIEDELPTIGFSRMHELRLLNLKNVQLSGCYREFPKKLKWLCWHGFRQHSLPNDFPLESIAVLEMHNSNLKQVWEGNKCLMSLKILDLSHSHSLVNSPDFSGLPNLERLIFADCINLVKVHGSVGILQKLVLLDLKGCVSLRKLPRAIEKLNSLEKLILSGCLELKFSMTRGKMSLPKLCADRSTRTRAESAAGKSEILDMLCAKTLRLVFSSWMSPYRSANLANSLWGHLPCNLKSLDLSACNLTEEAFPSDFSKLPSLLYLNLSKNPIVQVPENIKELTLLQSLELMECTHLQSLPELPSSLKMLNVRRCRSLETITNLPNFLRSLDLHLEDCGKLVEVQDLFKLVPFRNIKKMLSTWEILMDFYHQGGMNVELFNCLTSTKWKGPLMGLHEFGIFSTFLPGTKVPAGFRTTSTREAIHLDVPSLSNIKKCRLDICVVYTRSTLDYRSDAESYIKISNKSKRMKWIYSPVFHAFEGSDDSMLWISQWRFGDQLEAGDQVIISLKMECRVKELGVGFFDDELEGDSDFKIEEDINSHQRCSPSTQHVIGGDLTTYELNKGIYFLSNHP